MYWIAAASNRPAISAPLEAWFESGHRDGGLWMVHNYVKQARFEGNESKLTRDAWPAVAKMVRDYAGATRAAPGRLKLAGGTYHIVGCSSPEYKCYPPFQSRACSPKEDCNYELAQLRWGLSFVLQFAEEHAELPPQLVAMGIDRRWWAALLASELAWFPSDAATGFRLDATCAFECPHRHFSHLLQIFDLESVEYGGGNASLDALIHLSVDNWYRVTCNHSNWFNEECRGFTQCALASMAAVSERPAAAQGNLTRLLDSVVTPNGMYGEMVTSAESRTPNLLASCALLIRRLTLRLSLKVYQSNPDEFSPVSESAYCGAGVMHTMLLHTSPASGVLSIFPGLAADWAAAAFHQLRADGGLTVSAARANASTTFVSLRCARARTVLLRVPRDAAWAAPATPLTAPAVALTRVAADTLRLELPAATEVVLYVPPAAPPFVIRPLAPNASEERWFGYNRRMQPLH
jgi:hypothetical protein